MIATLLRFFTGKKWEVVSSKNDSTIQNTSPKDNYEIKEQKQTIRNPKMENEFLKNLRHVYLVTLDTTNRMEAKQIFRREGIQNFYFVYSKANNPNDEMNQAKQIVLSTFARKPAVVRAAQNSLKATPLLSIISNLSEARNFWTYVPMGGQRLAGQQSAPPNPDNLLKPNQYGDMSSQNVHIPNPVDVSPENSVNADDVVRKKQGSQTPQPPQMPSDPSQMTPEAMMAMMQQMMAMINNGGQSVVKAEPTEKEIAAAGEAVPFDQLPPEQQAKLRSAEKIQIGEDYNDPQLQAEIQALQENGIPSTNDALGDIDMTDVDPNEFKNGIVND